MRAEAMAGRLCTCFAGGNKDNKILANQKIACIEERMESSKRIDEEYDKKKVLQDSKKVEVWHDREVKGLTKICSRGVIETECSIVLWSIEDH